MEAGGWILDGAPSQEPKFAEECGGYETFWAYRYGYPNGNVSATFKGSGHAVLDFGNCYHQGVTKVYLNGHEIGSASPYQDSVTTSFSYKPGDTLTVTEEQIGIKMLFLLDC